MTFLTRRKLDTGDASEDFLVPLDQAIAMSWAYKNSAQFRKHDERGVWSLTLTATGEVEDGGLDDFDLLRNYDYEEHGWWLWGAWYPFGILLLVTKRYAKKFWTLMHYLHGLLGYFVMIVTLVFVFKVSNGHIHLFASPHHGLGWACVIVALVSSISGSATAGTMRFYNGDKEWAEKERVTRIAKIHRYSSYVALLAGGVATSSGLGHYFGHTLNGDEMKVLAQINFMTFLALIIIIEAIYRIRNKWSLGHVVTPSINGKIKSYTPEQIDKEVKEDKKPLVVFDNLVLDIDGYERIHPGGKFVLTHNYGRDISKFFFGGYNLVQVPGLRPHHHSQSALD